MVSRIEVRGARVHNLRNVDVDIPLNKIVGVAGGSRAGQTSAPRRGPPTRGARRRPGGVPTATRRRRTQQARAPVPQEAAVHAARVRPHT